MNSAAAGLSRGARRCLEALEYFANGKAYCWPKQSTLAAHVHCSLRSIKVHLEELRAAGMIVSQQRPNTSCMYEICKVSALPDCKETALPEENCTPGCTPSFKLLERKAGRTEAPAREHSLMAELRDYFGDTVIGGKTADEPLIERVTVLLHDQAGFAWFKEEVKRFGRKPNRWGFFIHVASEIAGKQRKTRLETIIPIARAAAASSASSGRMPYYRDPGIDIAALSAQKRMVR